MMVEDIVWVGGCGAGETGWTESSIFHVITNLMRGKNVGNLLYPLLVLSLMTSNNDDEVDLRALNYTETINANLICCICQAPFIDPVVLVCG